jgi:hypothetical protein
MLWAKPELDDVYAGSTLEHESSPRPLAALKPQPLIYAGMFTGHVTF